MVLCIKQAHNHSKQAICEQPQQFKGTCLVRAVSVEINMSAKLHRLKGEESAVQFRSQKQLQQHPDIMWVPVQSQWKHLQYFYVTQKDCSIKDSCYLPGHLMTTPEYPFYIHAYVTNFPYKSFTVHVQPYNSA